MTSREFWFQDVDVGLIVGLAVSLMFLVAWGYFPKIELVGRTEYQDLYLQADSFQAVCDVINLNLIKKYFRMIYGF